jgi:small neutral amino acid transporter SnatA (MarC family)
MIEDFQEQERKRMTRVKSTVDYTMGILFFVIGVYFLVYDRMGINVFGWPASQFHLFGGLLVLYAAWRVYRGYKKDYYR